jgi:RimJ/RimL family protein N-acetyltransferase
MVVKDSTRLSFRLMGKENAQDLWVLDQDPEVMRYLNGGKPTSMETINDVFIPRMEAYRNTTKGYGLWQVTDKKNQEYLGWILVRPMGFFTDKPDFTNIELGWRFFKKTWGKGYATEAAIAIKDAITHPESDQKTSKINIQNISALAIEDNLGSIAVMKKIGMHFIKKFNHEDPMGNLNAVHYQMAVK